MTPDHDANHDPLAELFSEPIYVYSREQAIADGVLIDATDTARQAGFRIPVALTAHAWADCVAWTAVDSARQTHQDETARLWDVLWMAYMAIRRASDTQPRLAFQFYRVPRGGRGVKAQLTTLHIVLGPGDNVEPVITILQPNED
ncbi:DUF6573 family protein [Achromobacter kerstersii]|uniref:DUF6573 family protein n=1 Tax=Achromobacter kerstersii TaxID=1353890 RepID=UPI0006C250C6|nr:DUF6573 family protein [Achromobacter kerstersii]CUI27343.1 Uncharacterised protein [Achromobacter kerstersii]